MHRRDGTPVDGGAVQERCCRGRTNGARRGMLACAWKYLHTAKYHTNAASMARGFGPNKRSPTPCLSSQVPPSLSSAKTKCCLGSVLYSVPGGESGVRTYGLRRQNMRATRDWAGQLWFAAAVSPRPWPSRGEQLQSAVVQAAASRGAALRPLSAIDGY
jgi:hypothetical protein